MLYKWRKNLFHSTLWYDVLCFVHHTPNTIYKTQDTIHNTHPINAFSPLSTFFTSTPMPHAPCTNNKNNNSTTRVFHMCLLIIYIVHLFSDVYTAHCTNYPSVNYPTTNNQPPTFFYYSVFFSFLHSFIHIPYKCSLSYKNKE